MAAATTSKISSVFRKGLFNDKVAIVTGGGTGIGKAITQELLYLGCNVMIASRNVERLEAAAQDINKSPSTKGQIDFIQCNIRKEDQVKSLISTTIKKFGKLDFLVNNGGGQYLSSAADISLKGWNAVVETNLTGTFLCCREAYNQWMVNNGGVIVNIIADMWKGCPTMTHTGAARSGVDNLTKSLAIEWADKGVRINSVAPGSSIYSETAAANYGDPKVFDRILHTVPAKRFGTTEEVSAAVCFLLCPAASFISGETVKVDAGASIYTSVWDIPDHNNSKPYKWSTDNDTLEDEPSSNKPTSKL